MEGNKIMKRLIFSILTWILVKKIKEESDFSSTKIFILFYIFVIKIYEDKNIFVHFRSFVQM